VPGAVTYIVYRNGVPMETTTNRSVTVAAAHYLVEYQVLAVDATGGESFLSEPIRALPAGAALTVKPKALLAREYAGYTARGYLRLTRDSNTSVATPVHIAHFGLYAVDARYANGNGPVNTEDKVAVRTLLIDGDTIGVFVMPQRGTGRWTDWGWTNAVRVDLDTGMHSITVAYTALDRNMNGRENSALLDLLRLTPLCPLPIPTPPERPSRGHCP
jgi:hypothetical protein